MSRELCFISVLGNDRKGIIASITSFLYRQNINIEDLAQKVMQGYFVMTMLVDLSESTTPLDVLRDGLEVIGRDMNLNIQIQHENIFKAMHRI
jgi:ACT domain-containing protein